MTLNNLVEKLTNEKVYIEVKRGDETLIVFLSSGYEGVSTELLNSTVASWTISSSTEMTVVLESAE